MRDDIAYGSRKRPQIHAKRTPHFACVCRRHYLSLRRVRHSFDVVPIRADNERPVIVRVIHLADSRRAIVLTARGQGCSVKSTHLLAILGNERNVH